MPRAMNCAVDAVNVGPYDLQDVSLQFSLPHAIFIERIVKTARSINIA